MIVFCPLPSALIVSIWSLPSVPWRTSNTKTTLLPSGDQWPSKFGVSFATSFFRSDPSALIVQSAIFPWWIRVISSREPSGDHWRCCLNEPSVVSRNGSSAARPAATTRQTARPTRTANSGEGGTVPSYNIRFPGRSPWYVDPHPLRPEPDRLPAHRRCPDGLVQLAPDAA